jgi:undecaprenyl diphosphate synthase
MYSLKNSISLHIALIMDGNGRWATQRQKPRLFGHRKGAESLINIIKSCPFLGIRTVTAYVFSTENWKRDTEEVQGIFVLIEDFLREKGSILSKEGIRIQFMGRRNRFSKTLLDLVESVEQSTQNNTKLCLRLAVDYGGRQEIARAAQTLAQNVLDGKMKIEGLNEDALLKALDTSAQEDPDLLIRTGGEQRLSNFLLFQNAYTELFFTKVLWPDFQPRHLRSILSRFYKRHRLFGGPRTFSRASSCLKQS